MTDTQLLEWVVWPGLITVTLSGGAAMYARWLNAKVLPLRQAETAPASVDFQSVKTAEEESSQENTKSRLDVMMRRRIDKQDETFEQSKERLAEVEVEMARQKGLVSISSSGWDISDLRAGVERQRELDYLRIVGAAAAQRGLLVALFNGQVMVIDKDHGSKQAELLMHFLKIQERRLGPNHPDVVRTREKLAAAQAGS